MAPRSPQLHHALRAFTLGAFAYLLRELDEAGEGLPFAFEEHDRRDGPTLYEYRPLVRALRRGPRGAGCAAGTTPHRARGALARARRRDLCPCARRSRPVRGRGALPHRPARPADPRRRGLRRLRLGRRVLRPRLRRARAVALRRPARLRRRRAARRDHCRAAASALRGHPRPPGRGRRAGAPLARGQGSAPTRTSGASPTATASSSSASALDAGEDVPDAPAEIADVVSAVRLATAAPLAAGPVLFETLDGRPYGIRPVLPIAATQPPGEPTKLDEFRGALAAELLVRLGLVDADTNLAEALDRWELSLFQHEPFRSEQLRAALEAALGTTWPLRASDPARDRAGGPRRAARRARATRGRRGRDTARRAPPSGARSSRSSAQATARPSSQASTASCSGSARRASASRSATPSSAARPGLAAPDAPHPARSRHGPVTRPELRSSAWRRHGAFSSGSSGSSPCDGRTRARSSSSGSSAPSSARPRPGLAAEGGDAGDAAVARLREALERDMIGA